MTGSVEWASPVPMPVELAAWMIFSKPEPPIPAHLIPTLVSWFRQGRGMVIGHQNFDLIPSLQETLAEVGIKTYVTETRVLAREERGVVDLYDEFGEPVPAVCFLIEQGWRLGINDRGQLGFFRTFD